VRPSGTPLFTFASALWCLDYMFNLAAHGCGGVNMETDVNQLGFISHYSPIVHDANGVCSARPEYYGMLAFAMAGHGELIKVSIEKIEVNPKLDENHFSKPEIPVAPNAK